MSAQNLTIISVIEKILALAKTGTLTGVAIATTHGDLSTGSSWCMEEATFAECLGSVVLLQHRMIKADFDASEGK